MESQKTHFNSIEDTYETDTMNLKNIIRKHQRDISDKSRLLNRKNKELDDLKASMNIEISSIERKYQDQTALYQKRAQEADRFAKDLEDAFLAGDIKSQSLIDQIKDKYVSIINQMETKLSNELEIVKNLTSKNK